MHAVASQLRQADGVADVLLNLRVRQAGNVDLAYLGEVNRTRAIDGELRVEIDLSPNANDKLITWSEYVVGSYIRIADRGKGRRHLLAK